jgi:hypothetical protein
VSAADGRDVVIQEVVMPGIQPGICALALLLTVACGGDSAKVDRTERERDSVIGQSALPGAQGVQGALNASDSARARNAMLDSAAAEP